MNIGWALTKADLAFRDSQGKLVFTNKVRGEQAGNVFEGLTTTEGADPTTSFAQERGFDEGKRTAKGKRLIEPAEVGKMLPPRS